MTRTNVLSDFTLRQRKIIPFLVTTFLGFLFALILFVYVPVLGHMNSQRDAISVKNAIADEIAIKTKHASDLINFKGKTLMYYQKWHNPLDKNHHSSKWHAVFESKTIVTYMLMLIIGTLFILYLLWRKFVFTYSVDDDELNTKLGIPIQFMHYLLAFFELTVFDAMIFILVKLILSFIPWLVAIVTPLNLASVAMQSIFLIGTLWLMVKFVIYIAIIVMLVIINYDYYDHRVYERYRR